MKHRLRPFSSAQQSRAGTVASRHRLLVTAQRYLSEQRTAWRPAVGAAQQLLSEQAFSAEQVQLFVSGTYDLSEFARAHSLLKRLM